jgi:uncharacterized protein (DUF362 family)
LDRTLDENPAAEKIIPSQRGPVMSSGQRERETMSERLDRRAFLKEAVRLSAAAGLGSVGGMPVLARALERHREEKTAPIIAVARQGSPETLVRAAVASLGGMGKFVGRGDIVAVKPNIAWDRVPEQAANTDPDVVKAVVQLCLECGAKQVRVFDRSCNDPRRCYKQSGIEQAVLSLGDPAATVEHVDGNMLVPRTVKTSGATWLLYRGILEADKVINVPIAKHHNAARLTMSLKNIMGVVGGNRGNVHHDLDNNIAELNTLLAWDLIVLDAVRILTAHGPQGGNTHDVKRTDTVVAGTDPVAVDSWAATLFGITGADVPHVVLSSRLGLGEIDLKNVRITSAIPG